MSIREIDMNKRLNGGGILDTGPARATPGTGPGGIEGRANDPMVHGEDPRKLREFIKRETEHIFEFIQEFVNEIAINSITCVKSTVKDTTAKMDSIDWMVRNIEFVSPKIYNNFIKMCHDIYQKNNTEKTSLYHMDHTSDVLFSLKKLILDTIEPNALTGIKKLCPAYLESLEVVCLNEANQAKAIEQQIHEILMNIITDPTVDETVSVRAEKSLSILLAKDNLIHKAIQKNHFVKWLANSLKKKSSDIVLTESRLNILALSFKSTAVTEMLLKHNVNLPNEVFKQLRQSKTSNVVLESNINCVYNFSTCTSLLDYITPPDVLETVIDTANEIPVTRIKKIIYNTLYNFSKKSQYQDVIVRNGMMDTIRQNIM
jgi:hypothetical protein